MKVQIVSSAEVAEQDTLSADYWVNRLDGESWPAFQRRRKAEDIERRARQHETAAARLYEAARLLRAGGA